MAGLKGTQRGNFPNPRIRRNWQRFATLFNMLGTGIDLVDGELTLAINAGDGIEITGGDTIAVDLAANSGLQFTGGDLDHLLVSTGALTKGASGLEVTISGMVSDASPTLADDVLVFEDITDGAKRKITFSEAAAAIVGSIDHGGLAGLADDDHTQYLLDAGATGGNGIDVTSRVVSADLKADGGIAADANGLFVDMTNLTIDASPDTANDLVIWEDVSDADDDKRTMTFDQLATALGVGGAPTDAEYVVISLNGTLSDERVLTAGDAIVLTDGGANGNATLAYDPDGPASATPVRTDEIAFQDVGVGVRKATLGTIADLALPANIGAAPDDASYVVIALDGDLSNERRLQVDNGLALSDGGANGDVLLQIDLTTNSGLFLDPGGLGVGAGDGLAVATSGSALELDLLATGGLGITGGGELAVYPEDATEITSIDGTADYLLISDDTASGDVRRVLANNLPGVQNPNSYFAMSGKNLSLPGATTTYMSLSGTGGTSLAVAEFEIQQAGTLQNLSTKVRSNGSASNGNTITVMVNGVASSLQTSYNATESGDKSDTSNTVTVSAGDSLAIRCVHAGGGFDGAMVIDAATWELIPA